MIGAITRLCKAACAYGLSETKRKTKTPGDRTIKALFTSVIAKYCDLSVLIDLKRVALECF